MGKALLWIPVLAGLTTGGCQGEVARPKADAPTIVSLNPCSDAILAEVLPAERLLAISHYSHDPAGTSMDLALARTFRATGGTVEEVLALDPDMVVGSAFMPPATRTALADMGVEVVTLGIASTVAESQTQVRELAIAVGEPERGEALARRMGQAIARLERGRSATPVSTVLWQPGGIVPGEATLVSELMRRAGLASHSAARGLQQADYLSLEQVLTDPPDVLLVAGAERAQRHPALDALPQTRREAYDPSLLYCGGPSVIRAAARLEAVRNSFETAARPASSSPPQDEWRKAQISVHPEEPVKPQAEKASQRT